MHSSDAHPAALRVGILLLGAALAAGAVARDGVAAAPVGVASSAAATPAVEPPCVAPAGKGGPAVETAPVLQAARRSPLLAVVARSGLKSCHLSIDDGAVEVTYRARDGSSFRFRRDPTIESSEYEGRFAKPPAGDPRRLLKQIEAQAFAPAGCGIDWSQAGETGTAGAVRTTVHRGTACNCQGRIERSAAGTVVGLVFSSAC